MASLVTKLRPDRTKTQRLSRGQPGEETPEKTPACQPGQQSIREILELLYSNPDEGGTASVPSLLLEGQSAPRRRATLAGISILPWEMFLRDPARLKDILHLGENHHISYKQDNVNALFRATYMDHPAFGDISSQVDAWVIPVEDSRELGKLRTLLTGRTSVLGMSIARYTSRWRTATRVPCLLLIDPDDDSVKETFDSAFNQAVQSMNAGKNFSFEVDLNDCVEQWCGNVLGAKCQSLGAKIIVTSGDPYLPVLTCACNKIMCCVLCFPLWGIQSCLYQIQRKTLYDDYNISPRLEVRLHDGGWVKQERRSANETCTSEDSGCSSPKANRGKSRCEYNEDILEMSYVSDTRPSVEGREIPSTSSSNNSMRQKSPRTKKRKDKRVMRPGGRTNLTHGKDNDGFDCSETSSSSGNNPSPNWTGYIQKVEPQGVRSAQTSIQRSGMRSRIVTSEMLLTDNVELTKFSKLQENDYVEKNNSNESKLSARNGMPLTSATGVSTPSRLETPDKDVPKSVTPTHQSGLKNHVQRFKDQQKNQHQIFARSESGSDISRDTWSPDSTSDSTSSGLTSSAPNDSPASDGQVRYYQDGLRIKKTKYGKMFTKPKSILKEFRKTTEGALSRLTGNGMDEFARAKPQIQRPSTAIPGQRRSVHFIDEATKTAPQKSNQSWLTSEVKQSDQQAPKSPRKSTNSQKMPEKQIPTKEGNMKGNVKGQPNVKPSAESKDKQEVPEGTASADGMLTNAWSFTKRMNSPTISNDNTTGTPTKSPNTPKSFLRPKAKVIFSTDDDSDGEEDWRSSTSRLILVNGPGKQSIFDSTELEKDTETDTEISHFRLEDVGDDEVNYLSDSHISVPSSRNISKSANKSKTKRSNGNYRRQQGKQYNLPRKRLYNPKKQSLSMLSLNALDL